MAKIHFILQGKGGVGKSMISSLLYQGISELGHNVIAYDTDPVNATFASYKEFNVNRLDLLGEDKNIDTRKFDELLEALAEADDNSHIIIDNGASSFIALGTYIKENDMIEALSDLGHTVCFHTVITGGQAIGDTLEGFTQLASNFPTSPLYVWLNPFFGAIEMDGKGFTDFKCYQEFENNITAMIELPIGNKALIGKDLEQLFAKKQSFNMAINGGFTHIAVRSRLKKYWNTVLQYIQEANIA